LVYPAPLLDLLPFPAGSSRSSRDGARSGTEVSKHRPPWPWLLLQSAHTRGRNPSRRLPKQWSWAPPLMVLPACAPPLVDHPRVHSSMRRSASFGPPVPPGDVSFRPHGLSPSRRFAPRGRCEFVAPRCQPWGSPRFNPGTTRSVRRRPGRRSRSPRRGSYPSKGSPRQQPYRITAAVALLPFCVVRSTLAIAPLPKRRGGLVRLGPVLLR